MKLHYLQHVPYEGLGAIASWAEQRGYEVSCTRWFAGETAPDLDGFDWLLIMGGPMNIYQEDEYPWLRQEKTFIRNAIAAGKTVIGVCLGAQLIADVLGGKVVPNEYTEIGWFPITATMPPPHAALEVLMDAEMPAFHWHGDRFELPEGARSFARSAACPQQGFVYGERVFAFQFHPEVTPEVAQTFIDADALPDGPYVQSPQAMMADRPLFERTQQKLFAFLDRLAALQAAA